MRPLLRLWRAGMGVALGLSLFGTGLAAQAPGGAVNTPNAAKADKDKDDTCRVSGMVVKMVDGSPLKNATVQLRNNEDREHTIATKTTAEGRFALRKVPPGRYKLVVGRNGYVEAEYGQIKPSDPGAAFSLSAGEDKHDLLFKLIPAAVISGRIFDEDGEPMPRVVVVALRDEYREGRRTMAMKNFAQSDDLGQFRLFGLAPGRYYVSASEQGWGNNVTGDREFLANEGQADKGYTKTYYPGTTELAKAVVISVKEGDEAPGTDIQLKQVAVYRIRGKVSNLITHKGGSNAYLYLMSRTRRLEWDFGGGQEVQKPDGSFEFPNVVPGSYLLTAYWEDQGKAYSTQERIDVGESDLEGISLVIGAGATIMGRIRWEGRPSLDQNELTVSAQPADMAFRWGGPSRVDGNQQFTLKEVGDGDFRVSVGGMSKDCYIKDTVYGDTHSAEGIISVNKGGGAPLEVTISSRGARVMGTVVDRDGLPAAGAWVVAVPDEARRNIGRLFKSQTTDQYGKFDLHGLAPGTYQLFSWTGIENGEWQDPDFLKEFEKKGESLEVQDDDAKTQNLKLIEKKSERE